MTTHGIIGPGNLPGCEKAPCSDCGDCGTVYHAGGGYFDPGFGEAQDTYEEWCDCPAGWRARAVHTQKKTATAVKAVAVDW